MDCSRESYGKRRERASGRRLREVRSEVRACVASAERVHQDDDDGLMDEVNSEVFQKETRASNSLNSHMYNSHEFDAHRRFDCNATNAALFCKWVVQCHATHNKAKDSVLIFADSIRIKTTENCFVKLNNPKKFWKQCDKDNCKLALVCHQNLIQHSSFTLVGCIVVLSSDDGVSNGKASGTAEIASKAVSKPSKHSTTLK